ncbi:MAG: Cys-tRNA(Pro) deacylase [Bacteroides sp.]|nr:Cys-tRNA(Pro) deacylase [Prevotella sp.]MCM1470682.1 Cys-tRNA(Pro) deacylase [Bacteroides sp.]
MKTNAMRILEKLHIRYNVIAYDDNEEHRLDLGAAARIAEKINADACCVLKTIVMRTETDEIYVFCVPANNEVNLKKARQLVGTKEIKSVKPEELLALTGYVRGGCSPLGMKRQYKTFIDMSVKLLDKVYVSAGQRGLQLVIAPDALASASGAVFADIAS